MSRRKNTVTVRYTGADTVVEYTRQLVRAAERLGQDESDSIREGD